MRGERVIVRAFRDHPIIARIWDASDKAVFICSEENFQRLANEEEGLWPVGFACEDVFRYDDALARRLIEGLENNPVWWQNLIPWREEEEIYQAKDLYQTHQEN